MQFPSIDRSIFRESFSLRVLDRRHRWKQVLLHCCCQLQVLTNPNSLILSLIITSFCFYSTDPLVESTRMDAFWIYQSVSQCTCTCIFSSPFMPSETDNNDWMTSATFLQKLHAISSSNVYNNQEDSNPSAKQVSDTSPCSESRHVMATYLIPRYRVISQNPAICDDEASWRVRGIGGLFSREVYGQWSYNIALNW